jgi:hypothetical protein
MEVHSYYKVFEFTVRQFVAHDSLWTHLALDLFELSLELIDSFLSALLGFLCFFICLTCCFLSLKHLHITGCNFICKIIDHLGDALGLLLDTFYVFREVVDKHFGFVVDSHPCGVDFGIEVTFEGPEPFVKSVSLLLYFPQFVPCMVVEVR